jgi:pilus assembly protein CpaC
MYRGNRSKIIIFTVSLCILLMFSYTVGSWAADLVAENVKKIQMVVGKSIVLKIDGLAKRVSIANPEVADFVLVSPHEVYVTAKAAGVTNLTIWQDSGVYAVYDLEVAYDISRLKEKLQDILPQETGLRVIATHDSITLAGRVSSSENQAQVLSIAQAYAPEGKIRNLLQVSGVQQVMLAVRVAEMQKGLMKRLGINFGFVSNSGNFGISKLAGLTDLATQGQGNLDSGGPFSTLVSSSVNALFRFSAGNADWTGFIDALREDGLVKILAEPTLIALTGQEAYFLAGGEFPVPVPQGLGTVAIDYKSFGVGLRFFPTVLAGNHINIKVAPEVSELDFSTAVQFQGFVVPGLSTRKAETTIELADGQSFAIAGLLRETVRDVLDKYPLLGDIPVLGALFRSRNFQKSETELVIIATPHLVKPLDERKQSLPTDFYVEPSDTDIYVMGFMEGTQKKNPAAVQGKLDGEFGHAVPK